MSRCALSEALIALLPGAVIRRRKECPWHSATFSGKRLELTLQILGFAEPRPNWALMVKTSEFSIADQLVADIAIVKEATTADGHLLEIEALLLDEEA